VSVLQNKPLHQTVHPIKPQAKRGNSHAYRGVVHRTPRMSTTSTNTKCRQRKNPPKFAARKIRKKGATDLARSRHYFGAWTASIIGGGSETSKVLRMWSDKV